VIKSKVRSITVVGTLLLLAMMALWFTLTQPPQDLTNYTIEKNYKWRYKLVNTRNTTLSNISFQVFAPHPIMANQVLKDIVADKTHSTINDSLGNRVLSFNIPEMAPHQTLFIDLKAILAFSATPQVLGNNQHRQFLNPSNLIESKHPKIIAVAHQLKRDSVSATVKANFDWVRSHLEYAGYTKEDRGALYAMEQKKGDCTEYAYLLTALLRASAIPARVIGGYVYPDSSVVRARDYHNWVEVFFDDRWHIVDPQKGRFLEDSHEYLAFRIIDDYASDLANSHQVIISDHNVKVSL
jgi:transglutaminase-like putative cysteine protease